MSANFELDLELDEAIPKAKEERGTGYVRLLVVLGLVGLVIALMMPSHSHCGPAMRSSACVNNVKQIAVALRHYEEVYKALPPAYTVDAKGRRLHSWRTLILPFLEQEALYRTIDLSKPWDDPVNAQAMETGLSWYRCPETQGWDNMTTYLAVVGPGTSWRGSEPRKLEEITDDPGSTLMVIEAGEENAVPWMKPVDADEAFVMGLGTEMKLPHSEGMSACFVDGSVRFLRSEVPAEARRGMISISGGEVLDGTW